MTDPTDLQISDRDVARLESILRSMDDDDLRLESPPDSIWAAIEREAKAGPFRVVTDDGPSAPVVSIFRRRPAVLAGSAAAVAAAVAVIAGVLVIGAGNDDRSYDVVGEAELVWDEGFVPEGAAAGASAEFLADGDDRLVRLDDANLPAAPGGENIELWLIGVEGEDLTIQSIGLIDDPAEPGTYDVPAAFDADAFDAVLVDISFEPDDGDATHSGASIIRGPISEA